MTTIHLAHTTPVNPPGTAGPILTQEQLFKGFQHKVRRPSEFVAAIAKAEILSEDVATGVIKRQVTFREGAVGGQPREVVEVCRELPPHRVDFELENGSKVWNIIGGDAPENLFVTYAFAWKHPELTGDDTRPTSAAYRTAEAEHKRLAKFSVESSIATTRKLVASGAI